MSDQLKRTPLYAQHIAAGAKMVDFGGFEMPLKYTSETAEHMAVRTSVGMFDVSHMGEVFVEGPRALDAIAHLVTNDPAQIKDGQAMYAGMLNERGTFVDDVVVYRFNTSRFLVVVNAGNRDKDRGHIFASINGAFGADTVARDEGDRWAQLAVQGPKAVDVVTRLCASSELASTARALGNYWFTSGALKTNDGVVNNTIISRTGYTGEDGYEIYVEANNAPMVWDAVLATGTDFGLVPCGLACRDTLRLEAGMCLYGNDIDEDHTPLEANLGFIVKGSSFIGKPALDAQKAAGTRRLLRGLTVVDRGIARHGYSV
ncbi:MAG TPA: glycine cleavage system aminomethyltransferase GcvT, partial [Myxococcota bacterium]